MLSSSNNTGILDTLDALSNANTGQDGVGGEALPIPATFRGAAERASDGAKSNVHTLALELLAHGLAAAVHQTPVKRRGGGLAGREDGVVIPETDAHGGILQT